MAYKKFESKQTRNGPVVAVRPDGRLRLNSEATIQFRSLGIKRVFLLWDEDRRRFALKRAPDDDRTAYKLTFSSAQNSIDIGSKTFLKHIGFEVTEKLDLPLEWNASGEMFEVLL